MKISINWISTIGLILDMSGVGLLFIYGLPSKIKGSGGRLLVEESIEVRIERENANSKIEKRANLALGLIIIGFILQLIGTNVSFS